MFWWGLLLVVQQSHRLLLLHDTLGIASADLLTIGLTLATGFRGDLTIASLGVLLGAMVALAGWAILRVSLRMRGRLSEPDLYNRCFSAIMLCLAAFCLLFLLVDMGYYAYSKQHPDLVFFEYLEDLFAFRSEADPAQTAVLAPSQALKQTEAELGTIRKWAPRVAGFVCLQALVLWTWARFFNRVVGPRLTNRERAWNSQVVAGTFGAVLVGFSGFNHMGPWAIARADIPNTTYYLLAQNPLWYTGDVLYGSFSTRLGGATARASKLMALDEAVGVTRETIDPGHTFVSMEYPLVRDGQGSMTMSLDRPPNVLFLFIEGLDRRFLGKAVRVEQAKLVRTPTDSDVTELYKDGLARLLPADTPGAIRLTPFLDRFATDSLYFENFFSPGDKTHHGLFSSLCSFYSGYGRSPIKSRYTYEYLCLPALLKRAGYSTEMVIGYNRDYHQDHTALFLGRNGVEQFLDESRFPASAERVGLGVSDGAVFDFMTERIRSLRALGRPFFLTTLTLNTHHPYEVPEVLPEITALRRDPDPYLAPLRYVDHELERFLGRLRAEGLLENTIVLILGDHGRHERIGQGGWQQFLGHHTIPLFLWVDPSVRRPGRYYPRRVSTVGSQVDLAPTVLGIAGLTPRRSAFVGKNLSCLLAGDCAEDNAALICGVERAALADRFGILGYSIVRDLVQSGDLRLEESPSDKLSTDPEVAPRLRRIKGLLVTAHFLLEKNRIWSWKLFEKDL